MQILIPLDIFPEKDKKWVKESSIKEINGKKYVNVSSLPLEYHFQQARRFNETMISSGNYKKVDEKIELTEKGKEFFKRLSEKHRKFKDKCDVSQLLMHVPEKDLDQVIVRKEKRDMELPH